MTMTLTPSIRRNTNAETIENLSREAGLLLDACGVVRSRAWLSRTVRDFMSSRLAAQMPFGLFLVARLELNHVQRRALAERADLRYLLTYSDPTGETAARNVDRMRRA